MSISNPVMLSSEVVQSSFDFGGFFIGLIVVIALIVAIPIICCCVGAFGAAAAVNSASRQPLVVNNNVRTEQRHEERITHVGQTGNYAEGLTGPPGMYQPLGYGNPPMTYAGGSYSQAMPYSNPLPMPYQASPPMPYAVNQGAFSGPAYPPYPPQPVSGNQRNPEPSAPYLNE